WVWDNNTCLNMSLRHGVTFHDGTRFNATHVQWTFDRLYNLIDLGESQLGDLYLFPNGTWILDHINIVSEYEIQCILTVPYAAFLDLLTFSGSYIIPKDSMPFNNIINYGDAGVNLIGTGPFKFMEYLTEDKVVFSKWADYWGTPANVPGLIFQVIPDANTRNQAMLNREIHFLPDPLPDMVNTFKANPNLYFKDGPDNLVIQYIGMNNKAISKTMRQVASYAFDYTYALSEVMKNQGTRLHGPIPAGMKTYNGSIPYVSRNVTKARELMINAGLVPGASLPANASLLTNDAFWTSKAGLPSTAFASYNYTYNADNQVRHDMGVLLRSSLAQCGIYLTLNGITWKQFVYMLYDHAPYNRNQLEFFFLGWGPDYNDPENYVSPLFSNASYSNGAQVDDPTLQVWIEDSRSTTDEATRDQIFQDVQEYLQTDLMPWIFVYQGHNLDVWVKNLRGYSANILDKHYFGHVSFDTTSTPPGEAVPIPIVPLLAAIVSAVALISVVEGRKLKRRS
ncbi:MAG: ABC transporter substrate-binding protein, partial [Candidatus Lokiarchaeota archaeon]|nr:ABC transporter substrate-binding protein [Candidatus Lokiarchaeota archaeon]